MEAEFNTTAEELIIAKARREETRNKMIKETERIEKGKRKLEESAAMIERNEEEYNRQMAEKTASKKLLDQSLKAAQEENSQLGAVRVCFSITKKNGLSTRMIFTELFVCKMIL